MINSKNGKAYNIMAYLSDSSEWEEEDIEVAKLTHINYAFGLIEAGRVVGKHLKKVKLLKKLKEKNTELKTVLSIGGWGAEGFSDAALTEESRNIFGDSAIALMVENHFDGLDIDWEYPCNGQAEIVARQEDRGNFTLFLKCLRDKLDLQGERDKKNYILSIALGAGEGYVKDVEMNLIPRYLDFINVMTYDMRGSYTNITGHHANLFDYEGDAEGRSGDKTVNILLSAGVPAEKIILGAAFYSRVWERVKCNNSGLNVTAETTGCKTLDYSILDKEYINKNGFKRYWDNQGKAPYLFDGNTFISYEDEESLKHKANYIMNKGIGGIMFWEYSLDNTNKLLNSIYSEII